MAVPVLVTGGGGAYGYGSMLERHRLTVEKSELTLDLGLSGPSRLRVVTLSDFHFDPLYEEEYIAECVRQTNALQPDVVLLTGDFITSNSKRIDDLSAILGALKPKVGLYACLGNHDAWDKTGRVMPSLSRQGIDVLVDQHSRVACGDGTLIVAGLNSAWGGRPSWGRASQGITPTERALLLMHEPDFANRVSTDGRIALQLSGHTHGGQIRLPGIGALELPSWGKIYQAGLYDVGGMKVYVNRGIGTITHHVRFLCPPEIACLDVSNSGAIKSA